MNMSVSQVIESNNEKKIFVLFEEENRSAEGVVPGFHIIKNNGFDGSEVAALEIYMEKNKETIENMAKSVSLWKAFSGNN